MSGWYRKKGGVQVARHKMLNSSQNFMENPLNKWIWGRPKKTEALAFHREGNITEIFYSNANTNQKETNDF